MLFWKGGQGVELAKMNAERSFSENHPRINMLIGLLLFVILCVVSLVVLKWSIIFIGNGLISIKSFLMAFVNSTDVVIVVAMITGTVSLVSVIISSVVSKIVEYNVSVKRYLYDKREEPYKQFIEMIYAIMEDTKKPDQEKMSDAEMISMISEFSKGLTLWGSNKVIKKWLKYRRSAMNNNKQEILFQMEDIIYEIRKDVGLGNKLKKGDMLSFFINDIDLIK